MDAAKALVCEKDIKPEDVDRITFYAGSNILNPIRYDIARDHLQAKFSMAALLAMMVLRRQAGRREFTDEFVASAEMQDMQGRITTQLDPEIEAQGFDIIRSRIEVVTRAGETLVQWADERYRGGPDNPLSDADLEAKVASCTDGILNGDGLGRLIAAAWGLDQLDDATVLAQLIQSGQSGQS